MMNVNNHEALDPHFGSPIGWINACVKRKLEVMDKVGACPIKKLVL
jgi:hypothetical protein